MLDFPGFCRACMDSKCESMFNLFTDELYMKFTNCTSLKVSEEDLLPKEICHKCFSLIEDFINFRNQCKKSEITFTEVLFKKNDLQDSTKNDTQGTEVIKDNINIIKLEVQSNPSDNEFDAEDMDYIYRKSRKIFGNNDHSRIYGDGASKLNISNYNSCVKTTKKIKSISKSLKIKKKKKKIIPKLDTEEKFICETCGRNFVKKVAIARHLRACIKSRLKEESSNFTATKIFEALYCGFCDTTLIDLPALKEHLTEHKESNLLACQLCDQICADFAHLLTHRYQHQKAGYRYRIFCYLCNKTFWRVDTLEFHFRGAHLNKIPGLCTVCGKSYKDMKHFKAHKNSHIGVYVQCTVCEKKFTHQKHLNYHMKCHAGKRYVCDICGFSCKYHNGLASHKFRKHSEHQPSICNHCGKQFKNKETLRSHLLRVNGERNFLCPQCNKGYQSQKLLELHLKWHSTDKPFSCGQCMKTYKCKAHLVSHMRLHSGERPFKCDICNKAFSTSGVLNKHRKIHTGEKPHTCQHCGKAFVEKSNLRSHLKTHKAREPEFLTMEHTV